MVVSDAINNIMGGMESTAGVRLHNHRRKLKQRFDLIKKLGQGTYGKVQLGINKETGQEVAIKTIKKSKIETEADLVRIRREIQIMSSVHHPNIIHIYEVFENREKMVLVMEYAAGGELYDFLSDRKVLIEAEARRIFRQISTAVFYCHKHNICHRDLKLENILLDEHGSAKIADFGLSNVYASGVLLATYCGSPLYASPEIVQGTPYRGPEVDCWSLGVLLYTLVYGAMPFDGSNFKRLVKQISTGDYFEPKNPSAASPLIRSMLCVDPATRADITAICSHWWMNQGQSHTCLELAEELANQTPVRLDLLLSLAPPPAKAAGEAAAAPGPARSMSVGSLVELDRPREVKRRASAAGQEVKEVKEVKEDAKEAAKRKLEPSASSLEEANHGAKRKERSKRREPSAERSRHRSSSRSATVLPFESVSCSSNVPESVSCSSSKMDVDEDSISIADIPSDDKKVKVKRKKKVEEKKEEVKTVIEKPKEEVEVKAEVVKEKVETVKSEVKDEGLDEAAGGIEVTTKTEVVEVKKPDVEKPVEVKSEAKPAEETKAVAEKPVELKPGEAKPGVIKKKLSVKKVPMVDKGEKGEEQPKPMVRRRSKVFESEIQKFNNMSAAEIKSPTVEKPKKMFIPGVKVSDFKKAFDQPPVPSSPSKKAATKPAEEAAKSPASKPSSKSTSKEPSPEHKPSQKEPSPKKEEKVSKEESSKKEDVLVPVVKEPNQKDGSPIKTKSESQKEPSPKKDNISVVKPKPVPQKDPSPVKSDAPVKSVDKESSPKKDELVKPVPKVTKEDDKVKNEVVKSVSKVSKEDEKVKNEVVKTVSKVSKEEDKAKNEVVKSVSKSKDSETSAEVKTKAEEVVPEVKAKTEELSKLKKNAIEIIGNAIAKPPKPLLEKIKPKPPVKTQESVEGARGPLSPKSPVSPSGTKLVRIQVGPGDVRNAVLKVSTPELTRNFNYNQPGAPSVPEQEPEKPKVSTKMEITLKSATLPRRKTTAEIKLSQPSEAPSKPPEYRTEVASNVGGNLPRHQRSEVAFPVAAAPTNMQHRSVSMEPESVTKPRERIIPIQFEREVPVRPQTESPTPSEPSLSRQSTVESESEVVKKSPREFIIPIAVEGGGYITPRAASAEPEQRPPTQRLHRLPRVHRISLLGESEDEGFNSPFSSLSRHQSEMEGELDQMHRLRSSRPRRAQVERAESLSSGEDDDEDGFELLTAESLFSTLLSRVRNLTQRLNVDDGGRPAFPHGRFMTHNFPQHSAFFNHLEPINRRVSETSRPSSRTEWRRSNSRDGDPATDANQPRGPSGPAEWEGQDSQYTPSLSRRMQQARTAQLPPPSRRPIVRTTSLKTGDDRRRGGYRSASVDRGDVSDAYAPRRKPPSLAEQNEQFGSTESLNRSGYGREPSYVPLRRNDSSSRRPSSVSESNENADYTNRPNYSSLRYDSSRRPSSLSETNDAYGSSESLNRQQSYGSLRRNNSTSRRPSSVAESNEPFGSNESLNRPSYSREQSYVPLRRNNSASRRLSSMAEPTEPYGSTDSLNRPTCGYSSPRYNLPSPGESKDPFGSSESIGYYSQSQGYVPLRRDNSASRQEPESSLTRQNIAALNSRVPARRNQYRSTMSDSLDYTKKPPSYLRQRAIDIANIYSPGLQDEPRRPTTLDIAPPTADDQPKSPGRRVSRFLRPDFYDTPREDSAFVKSPREETGRSKHIADFLEMNYADLERNIAKDLRAIGENHEVEVRNGLTQAAHVNSVKNIVAQAEVMNNIAKEDMAQNDAPRTWMKKVVPPSSEPKEVKKPSSNGISTPKSEVNSSKEASRDENRENQATPPQVSVKERALPSRKMIGMDVTSDCIAVPKEPEVKPKVAKKKAKKPDEEVKLRPRKESSNKSKFLQSLERSSLPVKRATSVDDCSAPGKVVRVIRSLRELVTTPSVVPDSETSLIQRATSSDDVTKPSRVTSVLGMFGARGAARWRRTQSVCVDDKRSSLDLESLESPKPDDKTKRSSLDVGQQASKVNETNSAASKDINSTDSNVPVLKNMTNPNLKVVNTNSSKNLSKTKDVSESKPIGKSSTLVNSTSKVNNVSVNNLGAKDLGPSKSININQTSATNSNDSTSKLNNNFSNNLNKSQDNGESIATNSISNNNTDLNNCAGKSKSSKPESNGTSNGATTNGEPVRVKSPRLPMKMPADHASDDANPGESIEERIRRKSFYSRFNDGKKRRASAIPAPREQSVPRRSSSFVNHSEEC